MNLKNLTAIYVSKPFVSSKLDALTTSGVYVYKKGKEILYIGKSINIKARILSHRENAKLDQKESLIVNGADTIECYLTDSDFNAILLESELIRKLRPKYNVRWKDDKSFLYLKITTKETWPKLYAVRNEDDHKSLYYGPFSSHREIEYILKLIRKIFSYCSQKNLTSRACFYNKIGLCDPCPNSISHNTDIVEKKKLTLRYRKNIRGIISIFEGNSSTLLQDQYKLLEKLKYLQKYEQAIRVRNNILTLEKILNQKSFSHYDGQECNSSQSGITTLITTLQHYFPDLDQLKRIECYDISNTSFKESTGSMVVCTDGYIDKSQYRRFKIRDKQIRSDFEMLHEVFSRRMAQTWQLPNLFIIDGGKPQIRKVMEVFSRLHVQIPLIGIAKHPDRIIVGIPDLLTLRLSLHNPGFNLVRLMRDESHRFAKKYHLLLRSPKMV